MSYNIEQINGGYVSYSSGALAISATAEKFKTTATVTFTNNGVFKSKTATDNLVFSTGHTSLAAGQACLFGVFLEADGDVVTTQGPIVTNGDPCPVPSYPSASTLIGLIKVATANAAVFVPNTTALDATDVTDTYINCSVMPGSAQ